MPTGWTNIQILKNEEIFILQIKMENKLDLRWGISERRRQFERKSDGKREIGLILWEKKSGLGINEKLCRVSREKEKKNKKKKIIWIYRNNERNQKKRVEELKR